jgi:hypothetical protein
MDTNRVPRIGTPYDPPGLAAFTDVNTGLQMCLNACDDDTECFGGSRL